MVVNIIVYLSLVNFVFQHFSYGNHIKNEKSYRLFPSLSRIHKRKNKFGQFTFQGSCLFLRESYAEHVTSQ